MDKIRIFISEDHTILRDGLKMLIGQQPDMEVIGEAGNGEETVEMVTRLRPDILIQDIAMPGLTGAQVVHLLKGMALEVHIIMLTVHEERSYLVDLIQLGVSGYVPKRAAASDLINAIHVVSKGGAYLDPTITQSLISAGDETYPWQNKNAHDLLSNREREVASLVAQGYTNREISEKLQVSIKTIDTYKHRVMQKMGLRNRADFYRLAIKQGWI